MLYNSRFYEKLFNIKGSVDDNNNFESVKIPITNSPTEAEIHFTHKCNLKCKHCFQNSSPNSGNNEMEPGFWKRIFDQFEKLNFFRIYISGGEPLFYFGFNEVMSDHLQNPVFHA